MSRSQYIYIEKNIDIIITIQSNDAHGQNQSCSFVKFQAKSTFNANNFNIF